jgi:hypothetical protein
MRKDEKERRGKIDPLMYHLLQISMSDGRCLL